MKMWIKQQTPRKLSYISTYFKNMYSKKLENLKEMDIFLHGYHLPKLG